MLRIVLLAALCVSGWAQHPVETKEPPPEVYPFFTDAEVRLMLDFYRPGSGNALPKPERRAEGAKPEAAKAPAIGVTLASGWEKRAEPFPKDLERRLISVRPGYRRILAGANALMVKEATGLIVDLVDLTRR